jgi:hypothetical protein
MSDTPETDAEELVQIGNDWRFVNVDFARKLERERDEARDTVLRLRKQRAIARNFGEQMERERDKYRRAVTLIAEDCESWLNSENDEPSAEFIKLVAKYAREAIK